VFFCVAIASTGVVMCLLQWWAGDSGRQAGGPLEFAPRLHHVSHDLYASPPRLPPRGLYVTMLPLL
jgi:hypothetical protein